MRPLHFVVLAVPVAQPRQRHRVARIGGRHIAKNYTPKSDPVNTYKAALQMVATGEYRGPPLDGPLRVDLTFVFPRPKGRVWKSKPMPREPHTKKPDMDNLYKSTMDALNGLVWRDDAQVCACAGEKWIASGDEQPHVEIKIWKL